METAFSLYPHSTSPLCRWRQKVAPVLAKTTQLMNCRIVRNAQKPWPRCRLCREASYDIRLPPCLPFNQSPCRPGFFLDNLSLSNCEQISFRRQFVQRSTRTDCLSWWVGLRPGSPGAATLLLVSLFSQLIKYICWLSVIVTKQKTPCWSLKLSRQASQGRRSQVYINKLILFCPRGLHEPPMLLNLFLFELKGNGFTYS